MCCKTIFSFRLFIIFFTMAVYYFTIPERLLSSTIQKSLRRSISRGWLRWCPTNSPTSGSGTWSPPPGGRTFGWTRDLLLILKILASMRWVFPGGRTIAENIVVVILLQIKKINYINDINIWNNDVLISIGFISFKITSFFFLNSWLYINL